VYEKKSNASELTTNPANRHMFARREMRHASWMKLVTIKDHRTTGARNAARIVGDITETANQDNVGCIADPYTTTPKANNRSAKKSIRVPRWGTCFIENSTNQKSEQFCSRPLKARTICRADEAWQLIPLRRQPRMIFVIRPS
jgi:hypothetical protein